MLKTSEDPIKTTKWATAVYEMPASCSVRYLPTEGAAGDALRGRGIVLAGINELDAQYLHRLIDPPFHGILLTLDGRGILRTPTKTCKLKPSSIGIIPAHCSYECAVAEDYWKVLWLIIEESDAWAALSCDGVVVRRALYAEELGRAAAKVLWETLHAPTGSEYVSHLHVELLAVHLYRETLVAPKPNEFDRLEMLQRLWDKVSTNLQHHWTVQALAEEACMSASNLHRTVAAHAGTTPMGKVKQLRMRRAEELLRLGGLPIKNIAALVGYDNPFSFSAAFKKTYGCSPQTYRENNLGSREAAPTQRPAST